MSNSTDEDDQRLLQAGKIGVMESEGEAVLGGGEVASGLDEGNGEESQLIIAETTDEAVTGDSPVELEVPVSCGGRGFGEKDDDSDSDKSGSSLSEVGVPRGDTGDDDDDDDGGNSVHSASSDARHELDYLHDLKGEFLSELLVAS